VTVAVSARISALLEGVTIALDAIRANKVRAALTILGIAVGVFSVTAMAAMIHGINESVAKDIESAGATTFFITRWPVGFNSCDGTDELCPWRHNPGTSFAEMTAIGRLPSVQGVMGELDFNGVFKYGDRALPSAQLTGYTPGWEQMTGGDINPGRSFTIEENASGARVVLLNDIAVKHLFADSVDPVGKSVTIDNAPFEVIGWYHYHPSFFTGGEHAMGIIPVQTLLRHYKVWVPDMWVSVKPVASVPRDQAIDDIIAYLRGARGLRPERRNNFEIITQDRLFQVYNNFFGVIGAVTLTLSAVGLLVGGVGVIAIMMISVTERTREIGVRKALGATRLIILWQFLIEAVTLTSIGVGIGFLLGWGAAAFTKWQWPNIPASVPPVAVLFAIGASIITGIAFGVLPAVRASRLDPVTALRYE
jgi:putative ABC transport system permease protein